MVLSNIRKHDATPLATEYTTTGNKYIADLGIDTARFLQTVAWETTQQYFGR
jgi:hypothetical protein